jgi:hypothetical protein
MIDLHHQDHLRTICNLVRFALGEVMMYHFCTSAAPGFFLHLNRTFFARPVIYTIIMKTQQHMWRTADRSATSPAVVCVRTGDCLGVQLLPNSARPPACYFYCINVGWGPNPITKLDGLDHDGEGNSDAQLQPLAIQTSA